jgi:hypothetical protein
VTEPRELNVIFDLGISGTLILENRKLEPSPVPGKGIVAEALIVGLCEKLDTL